LYRFLSAAQLLQAAELRARGHTWQSVAKRLSISCEALRRRSIVWPGCSLAELGRIEQRELIGRFTDERLALVIGREQ